MRKKIISAAVVVSTITMFAITSQPKTAIGSAAMTFGDFTNDSFTQQTAFVMPTMQPFPTLNLNQLPTIQTSTPKPTVSTTPKATITPTTTARAASPTTAATPKPTTQATATAAPSNNSYIDQVISLVNTNTPAERHTHVPVDRRLRNSHPR